MSVKVRVKRGKYYLDIYQNGSRRWESLHLTRTGNPAMDREKDKLAEICRAKREMQLVSGEYNVPDVNGGRVFLYEYMAGIGETKKTKKSYREALNYLAKFPGGREIRLNQVDEAWLAAWQRFLRDQGLASSSQRLYDSKMRAVLNQAEQERRITRNPTKAVKGVSMNIQIKDVLTIDDLEKLVAAPLPGKLGAEIKRAFLFACWTGLRISDIRTLKWKNIEQDKVRLMMHKTQRAVEVPIHPMAMVQLEANDDELVFPRVGRTNTNCIAYLKRWTAAAGVDKHIGWHTARRTFATLAVEAGVDQYVISKLLGHTTMTQTATYSQVPITTKRAAVAKLPDFKVK